MFVDTSAIVAILCGEPDAAELAQTARRRGAPTSPRRWCGWKPAWCWRRGSILRRRKRTPCSMIFSKRRMCRSSRSTTRLAILAVACFETFGKGRHPARLNLGDCLSYACAKAYRSPLLFKGDDFSQTDMATTNPNASRTEQGQ